MHRFWQTLKLYRGFILAGILALIVIGLFLSDTNSGRSAKSKQDAKSIKFLSLAWQVEAITAIRKMVAQWNDEHPEQPVELIQGTWSSVHDFLITGFETGDIPDIFHYESAIIVDFALRDYLADLAPYIQDELKQDVLDVAWSSVTRSDGQVIGIPFLAESFIVLYNKKLFAEAGISAPSFEKPWAGRIYN